MIGCMTCTPTFEATAPVMKGNAADPACPKLAVKPINVKNQHNGFKSSEKERFGRIKMIYLRHRCEVPVE